MQATLSPLLPKGDTVSTIAFYCHTDTTSLDEIVVSGRTVGECFHRFVAENGLRSVSYTRNMGPMVPLVRFA
jgi:hypothetical protein